MASGDPIFTLWPQLAIPASTNFPTPELVALTGTGAAGYEYFLAFDGSTDETCVFPIWWSTKYDGGGINLYYAYMMSGTTQTAVELEFSFMTGDDLEVATTKAFQTAQGHPDTPGGTATANRINYTAAKAISHALCDSPNAGTPDQKGWVRCTRDISHATNTNDLRFLIGYGVEQ